MFRTRTHPAHSASLAIRLPTGPIALMIAVMIAAGIALAPRSSGAKELGEARDCVIVPHRIVDVSSAVPGLLESVSIERSDLVVSGQELARLESATERASMDLADAWASIRSEIHLESISQGLDNRRRTRVERLYASKAVALDDKDQAETDASLAEVRLRQAREKRWIRELDAKKAEALLQRRTVRSPIDGVIVERFRSGGEYVENQPIVRIAQLDPLQVETILPMREFGNVQPGMQATVRAEHDPDSEFTATVSVVDRVGDAASGTFGVRLSLANPEHLIPAGLKCTLSLLPMPVVAQVPSGSPSPSPQPSQPQPPSPEQWPTPPATVDAMSAASEPNPAQKELADWPEPVEKTTDALSAQAAQYFGEADDFSPAAGTAPRTPLGLSTVAAAEPVCLAVGPLDSVNTARRLMSEFELDGGEANLVEEQTRATTGYIVVSTPASGDGARHVERMRAAGVHDLLLMGSGNFRGLVSLGVYVYASAAERRREAIAALGFDSEVRPRTRNTPRWWLTLSSPSRAQAAAHANATLESLTEATGTTGAMVMPCSESAPLSAGKRAVGDARPRV